MIPRPMLEVLGMVSSLVEVLSLPGFRCVTAGAPDSPEQYVVA